MGATLRPVDLHGLTSGQAIAAFAASFAVVTALYLLKLRRRRVEVASIELWRQVLGDARTSGLFSRLTRWGSWLLALSLTALVLLALADPRPPVGERTLHVLLVDASLSMQATDVEPSRFARAIERAHTYVDRLPEGDVAMVVGLSAHPAAEPITSEPAALHRALDALEVTDGEGDVARALHLAMDATLDQRPARIVLFSDGAFEISAEQRALLAAADIPLLAEPLGESTTVENVAITALAARPHPLDASRAEVLLEVQSFASRAVEVEVRLETEGRSIEVLRLSVPPGERVRRFFEDITGLDRTLEAHLDVLSGVEDRLPGDDHAYARIATRSRTRVAVVSRDNAYLEAALLLDEALEVTEVAPGSAPDPSLVDVAIFDGVLPSAPYRGPAIYLHPDARVGGASPLDVTGEVERPRFDVLDDEHPLLRWVSLRNVNIARALQVLPGEGDDVVAGDEGVPLLVAGAREGARFVALTFDAQESDLPLRIAWPVFLLDAIAYLTPHEERDPSFARAGERFFIPLPAHATEAFLDLPPGARTPVPSLEGRARLEVAFAGLHRLETDAGEILIAVSPAAGRESSLMPLGPVNLGAGELSAPVLAAPRPARHLWEWMALGALGLLLVEAVTYHRRWTV